MLISGSRVTSKSVLRRKIPAYGLSPCLQPVAGDRVVAPLIYQIMLEDVDNCLGGSPSPFLSATRWPIGHLACATAVERWRLRPVDLTYPLVWPQSLVVWLPRRFPSG